MQNECVVFRDWRKTPTSALPKLSYNLYVLQTPSMQEEFEDSDGDKKEADEISRLEQRRLLLKQREKEMEKYLVTKPDEVSRRSLCRGQLSDHL